MSSDTPTSPDDEAMPSGHGRPTPDLESALQSIDPEMAGLYGLAVDLFPRVREPGIAHALAHCGREILNGIVRKIVGQSTATDGVQDDRYRSRVAQLLDLPRDHPSVKIWVAAHDTFQRVAHVRDTPISDQTVDELGLALSETVELLESLIGLYYFAEATLDELLSVSKPHADDIDRLRRAVVRPSLRRYFFTRLSSEAWLEPLDSAGMLDPPGDPHPDSEGMIQYDSWPEGQFVARVAEKDPDGVLRVLERVPSGTRNPFVSRSVAEAIAGIPGHYGSTGAQLVCRVLNSASDPRVADPAIQVALGLLDIDADAAFALLAGLLFVDKSLARASPGRAQWLLPRLRFVDLNAFHRDVLPRFLAEMPLKTFRLLWARIQLARRVVELSGGFSWQLEAADLDGSLMPHPDPAEFLAQAACAAAVQAASSDEESARLVLGELSDTLRLTQRIYFTVLTEAGHHVPDLVDAAICSREIVDPTFGSVEVARFLRKRFEEASPASRLLFVRSLRGRPESDLIYGWLRREGAENPSVADVEAVLHEFWRRRIRWFRGKVPDELTALAEEIGELGMPSADEIREAEGSPTSGAMVHRREYESKLDEILHLTTDELVQFVADHDGLPPSAHEPFSPLYADLEEISRRTPSLTHEWIAAATGRQVRARNVSAAIRGLLRSDEGNDQDIHDVVVTLPGFVAQYPGPRTDLQDLLGPGARLARRAAFSAARLGVAPVLWGCLEALVGIAVESDEPASAEVGIQVLKAQPAALLADAAIVLSAHEANQDESEWPGDRLAALLAALGDGGAGCRQSVETAAGIRLATVAHYDTALMETIRERVEAGLDGDLLAPGWYAYVTGPVFTEKVGSFADWYNASFDALSETTPDDFGIGVSAHILIAVAIDPTAHAELFFKALRTTPIDQLRRAFWTLASNAGKENGTPRDGVLRAWRMAVDEFVRLEDQERAGALSPLLLMGLELVDESEVALAADTAVAAAGRVDAITLWDRVLPWVEISAPQAFRFVDSALRRQISVDPGFISVDHVSPVLESLAAVAGENGFATSLTLLIHDLGSAGYRDFKPILDRLN